MIRDKLCVLALAVVPAFADLPKPVIVNAVRDQYRPLAFDQQKLAGLLAERMRAAREGYLEHVNDKAMLEVFQSRGHAAEEMSLAEKPGKFLEAAASAYDYSHDVNLKAVMDRVAREFMALQLPDGYLGLYPEDKRWNTSDVRVHRYALAGLLAYYRVTANETAFNASQKIGDLAIASYRKVADARRHAFGVLIEPIVQLYIYTGNAKYLEFAQSIAQAGGAVGSFVDASSLDDSISTLTGLVELYRVTGDTSFYNTPISAWPIIRNRYFLTFPEAGSPASRSADLPGPCMTEAWIRLTLDLLRLTGQTKYSEELEQIIYNQLFAAEDPKTGNIFSDIPLNGKKLAAPTGDRCTPSEAAGISLIPAAVWGRYGNGIAMLLYTPGRATFRLRRRGTVQFYAETAYPANGDILLHVEPAHPIQFPLRLRVPEWTNGFVVDIGGSHLIGRPGEFVTIVRQWNKGDTVKVAVNLTVRVIENKREKSELAIQRGPQVLALGQTVNPGLKDLGAAGLSSIDPARVKLTSTDTRLPATWAADQAYTIAGQYEGRSKELVLVPFADATNYRVFLKRPVAVSGY